MTRTGQPYDAETIEIKDRSSALAGDIRSSIKMRYMAPDNRPWILAYSGGKDSTVLAQLVFETLLEVPPKRRVREVFILSSDTQVETPYIADLVAENHTLMDSAAQSLGLPVKTILVKPQINDTFWVRVIGYGYPPPSRLMRWCTDRLKIKPANRFILGQVAEHGEVIVLLGARYEESQSRAASMRKHESNDGLFRHATLPSAFVWAPIRHLSSEDVWSYLVFNQSPWGGDNHGLRDLYKSANAGECPVVLDETTEPCGNSRFGCYTCTVVDRDKSLEGFVRGGRDEFEPLLELRNWLLELRDDPQNRDRVRRNGEPGIGPLKLEIRKRLLERVLEIQAALGKELITDEELAVIHQAWLLDTIPELPEEAWMADLTDLPEPAPNELLQIRRKHSSTNA